MKKNLGLLVTVAVVGALTSSEAFAFGKGRPWPRPTFTIVPIPTETPTPTPTETPSPTPTTPAPVFSGVEQTDEAVRRLFLAVLHRNVDPGGLEAYRNHILREGRAGWEGSLRAVAESDEFRLHVRPRKTDEQLVAQLYTYLLLREPDEFARLNYLPMIQSGHMADAVLSIGTSDEFFQKISRPIPAPSPSPTPTPTQPAGDCQPLLGRTDMEGAIKETAVYVKQRYPELFATEDRVNAYHMMTKVLNTLRHNGHTVGRTLNHPSLPAQPGSARWGTDALGYQTAPNVWRIYDIYVAWPHPGDPAAQYGGDRADNGVDVTSDLIPVGGGTRCR